MKARILAMCVSSAVAMAASSAMAAVANWGQPYADNDPNTLVLLHLNESSGTTAANTGDTGTWGTSNGTYSAAASGNVVSGAGNPASGFGNAFKATGSNSISVPSDPDMVGDYATTGFTVEAWFKVDAVGALNSIVSKYAMGGDPPPNNRAWEIDVQADGTIHAGNYAANSDGFDIYSTTVVTAGQWHHTALVYDINTGGTNAWRLYLDGNLEASYAAATWSATNDGNQMLVGAQQLSGNPAFFFKGEIDEVRISRASYQFQPVPEPASLSLLALGGLMLARRRM